MSLIFLTMDEVEHIHNNQIAKYGGASGIRDAHALDSALAQPATSFEGKELHPDIYSKAAAYLFHICMNHAFVDGNKRTATAAALVFLLINGHRLNVEESLLEETVLEVARSKKTKEELVEFFKTYTSTI